MKKIIIIFLLLGTLSVSAKNELKKSKRIRKIENTYAAAHQKADLRKDKVFMKKLLCVIAKADDEAAYMIDRYYVFIYASGLRESVARALAKMPNRVRQSEIGIRVQNQYYSLRDLNEGDRVPDFTMNTPDGKRVNFYTFLKGKKCVLLDFWASWCKPCCAEMPELKRLYDQYKQQGFEIIGISLEQDKDSWKAKIEELQMDWPQLLDVKEEAARKYVVGAIPHTVLIDPSGVIIAKNLRGKELEEKITKLVYTTKETFKAEMFERSSIGTISEIYDSIEPYEERGAFAQAWSVAEIFRIVLNKR